jgi:hypothetical protein
MRTRLLLGALTLALVATAAPVSAWQTYTGSFSISGFATTCVFAITPIMNSPGYVFQNFAGTINSSPATWGWVVVIPSSGSWTCVPFGGGFLVSGSGTAMAFGGP